MHWSYIAMYDLKQLLQVLSKSALKNKKRKEAAKAAKLAEAAIPAQRWRENQVFHHAVIRC